MSQSSGIINSLFWKTGERFMVQGIGLLVQIILARLLMPEDFASLAIITAIVNYLGLFVQSGLSIAVVQKKNLTKNDISTLTTISLLAALLMYIVLWEAAPLISDFYKVGELTWPIRVMGLTLFLFAFNSIQTGILQREMMFRAIFFRSLLATPLSGIIGIVMAYMGFGIWALIAYNISNILAIVVFMNLIPELRLRLGFSLQSAKELYSFSIKILGTSLVSAGGDTIRTLTIGKCYSPNQLAYFDRGLNYSGLVTHVVNTSLSSVLLPVLSRNQDDIIHLKSLARQYVSMSAFIMVPVLTLVAVSAKPLIIFVLSEKWLPCAIYLSLFCLLRIPGIISTCDKQVYYALGKSQIGLYYEICLLLINLLALIVLIKFGVIYIAIGLTILEYVGNFVIFVISSKIYQYTIKERIRDLIKPFFNAFVMATVMYSMIYFIQNDLFLLLFQVIIGLITYLVMTKLTKDNNLQFIIKKLNNNKL